MKKKSRIRGGHRSYARKVMIKAKGIISANDPTKFQSLKHLVVTLKDKIEELKLLDSEIAEQLDSDDEIDREVMESCEFADEIRACVIEIETFLEKDKVSISNLSSVGANGDGQSNAKLPKLRLDNFSGNPVAWNTFWDSFKSAVHNNSKLTPVDKFTYLKSLLEGTAANTVAGLTLTSENYEKAITMLKDRFGNRQIIITSHLENLTKISKVESVSDVNGLRNLFDMVEGNIRGLESMDIKSDMYGCFLMPLLMQKLPEEFRVLITRDQSSELWDLQNVMSAFNKELKLREQCLFSSKDLKPFPEKSQGQGPKGKPPSFKFSSSHALLSGNESATSKSVRTVWCSYCKQQHQGSKCTIITDPVARKKILKEKGKYFLFLPTGHLSRSCQSGVRCFKCQGAHHISICQKEFKKPYGQVGQGRAATSTQENSASSVTMYTDSHLKGTVLLQTARAVVFCPHDGSNSTNVRLVFDSCSQRSYITEQLKNHLCLPVIGKDSLLIKTFGENDARLRICEIVQVAIETLNGTVVYVKTYVVPTICGPLSQQPTQLAREKFQHLQGLMLADSSPGDIDLPIDILVGADFYWALVDGTVIRGQPTEPVAISTKLGYVLSGPVSSTSSICSSETVNFTATHVLKVEAKIATETVDPLKSVLQKFWDYETLGIKNQENSVYDNFVENVEFVNGKYQVRLPFKEDHELLPDNFLHSKIRLHSLLRRMQSKPEILAQYNNVIQEQLSEGIIEPVPADSDGPVIGRGHYIPHREVIREDKNTTKLRVVYDASARVKEDSPSLNDCLYAGPPLSPLIYDILLRFSSHKIALTADIEKAFLNVSVNETDRDFLRFLWVNDISNREPELCVYRFARVVFGVSSSPFLLNATNQIPFNPPRNL